MREAGTGKGWALTWIRFSFGLRYVFSFLWSHEDHRRLETKFKTSK